jgi:hypothetical protein
VYSKGGKTREKKQGHHDAEKKKTNTPQDCKKRKEK